MLRRYSPRGIESTALRLPATLIGSSEVCDIVIKSKDVEEKHALVEIGGKAFTHTTTEENEGDEFAPKGVNSTELALSTAVRLKRNASAIGSRQKPVLQQAQEQEAEVASFADLRYKSKTKPEEHEPEARQRALETAQQELLNYGAMLELRPADTLRFGTGDDAVEYIFEMPPIVSKPNQQTTYVKPNSSSTNSSSYASSIMMQRRSKKKKIHSKSSFEQKRGLIVKYGINKVNPRIHTDRFIRPQIQTHNRRLCHIVSSESLGNALPSLHQQNSPSSAPLLRNRSSSVQSSKASSKEKQDLPGLRMQNSQSKANNEDVGEIEQRWPQFSNDPFHGENISIEGKPGTSKQVGNQLLQRVIRLQAEIQRRDAEIAQLRDNLNNPSTSGDRAKRHLNNYRESLSRAQTENENLKAYLDGNTNQKEEAKINIKETKYIASNPDFTELICSTFFKVCYEELDALNNRVSNSSRDYADIFSETIKALQEPFSFRLMEINTKCSAAFEEAQLGQTDKDQLYTQFDKFLKEKIYVSRQLH
uniref:FHA domain-containing protein n=1 Tax=Ditylenchus dipsaci TaxID=166011 RepID=A0A915DWF7_9BILA